MRRRDVAKLFNVSVQTVRNWEKQGRLHARLEQYTDGEGNIRSRRIYDAAEVNAWRLKWKPGRRAGSREKARTGMQHGRAFELFAQGYTAWDVVRLCKIDCDTALDLAQKYFAGPHAAQQERERRSQEAEAERWRREMNDRYRKAQYEEHQRELARLRAKSPAPIILTRVESGATLPTDHDVEGRPPRPGEESGPEIDEALRQKDS